MNNKVFIGLGVFALILATWGLTMYHDWVVLQETNAAVACEETNADSSFCVVWYKSEFNKTFPS